jgi:glutamine synthetase
VDNSPRAYFIFGKDGITMKNIPELFGSMVSMTQYENEIAERLLQGAQKTIAPGGRTSNSTSQNARGERHEDWAVEKGATHFTHWFQPIPALPRKNTTALSPPTRTGGHHGIFPAGTRTRRSGRIEFPIRRTSRHLRGKGVHRLGHDLLRVHQGRFALHSDRFLLLRRRALDKKTPLLRSMEAIDKQALRIVRLFGNNDVLKRVITTVGPEQEYFLIDKEVYLKASRPRLDGKDPVRPRPPQGQELEDHYFGKPETPCVGVYAGT